MSEFLRRLRIAWKFAQNFPTSPLPNGYWLPEDAQALSNWLVSDSGVKLRWILRNRISDTANRAVMEMGPHSAYLCGYAAGTRGVVAEMDSLLQISSFGMSDEESQSELESQRLG
jgi:hypothetical protein